MNGPAFFDARCPKCKAHIGWSGRVTDRPACRRCSHRPPDAELQQEWRQARIDAGLSLTQAAKLLEVEPLMLAQIERGQDRPSEALAERMARCYGGY